MTERVRNVIKRDCRKNKRSLPMTETPPVKRKKKDDILRRYPIVRSDANFENEESIEQHKKALEKELGKNKPRDSVLSTLMKSTFAERRLLVLDETNSVDDILKAYPALKRPTIVYYMS